MDKAVMIENPASGNNMKVIRDQNGNEVARAPALTWLTLRRGLKLEVNCPGMQLTGGQSCSARVKAMLGLRRGMRKVDVLDIMNEICDQILPPETA